MTWWPRLVEYVRSQWRRIISIYQPTIAASRTVSTQPAPAQPVPIPSAPILSGLQQSTPSSPAPNPSTPRQPTPQTVARHPEPPCSDQTVPQTEHKVNRHERRRLNKYERARRRFDKFVDPHGPQPLGHHHRLQQLEPVPEPVEPVRPQLPEPIIVDKHHEDPTGPAVLYTEAEIYGAFSFRDTILQQLDRYFVYLRRMQKYDPDAYGFYRQFGALVVPYAALGILGDSRPARPKPNAYSTELSPWFLKHRPGFGCVAFGTNPFQEAEELTESTGRTRLWFPKFMYFVKYVMPPPELEPTTGGDVYRMTIWWDRPQDRKYKHHGSPQDFGVWVGYDGSARVLRMLTTEKIRIQAKELHRRGLMFSIPSRAWRIPHDYQVWAQQHGLDANKYLLHLFSACVGEYERANYSMVRVTAEKNGMAATFGVDVKRMAYFFKDRDVTLNEHGERKRIFHIVRPHERELKGGDTTTVKMHFRGLREFTWAGHKIMITVPGRDHHVTADIDIGSYDLYWIKPRDRKRYVGSPEFARRLVEMIKRSVR